MLVSHLNREPADTDALTLLASALVQVGREKDARLALTRALRHNPKHVEALALEAEMRHSEEQATGSESDVPLEREVRLAS